MIRSTESIDIKYFKDIRMFIAAWYACNMSDEELWISNALFESILWNVLKDV
jgi:hypothetical protein